MFLRRVNILLYTILLSFCGVSMSSAQERDTLVYELEDVVAVGDRSVTPETSGVPLQRFDADDIERLALWNLADALKRFSGVSVHDYGGVGGLKTVSVRGLGAKHTAVSYDGAVVSDAQSGMIDLGRFALENVSAVSLTIGQDDEIALRTAREYSLSSLVAMRSSRIPAGWRSHAKLLGGSFGLMGVSAYGGYGSVENSFAMSMFGSYLRSDGMYPFTLVNGDLRTEEKRRDSDSESFVFEGNMSGTLLAGTVSAKFHLYASERGLPGAVNLYNKENRERLWNKGAFAQVVYDCPLFENLDARVVMKYDFNHSRYKENNKNYASGVQVDKNVQNEGYVSFALAGALNRAIGYSVATDISYATLENNFNNSKSPRRLSSYSVLAVRCRSCVATVTASLLATYIKDDVRNAPSPYKRLSPALSLSVKPFSGSSLRLRFSVKDSYRVPTFADLYYLRLGNVALKPERATQYNAGVTLCESFAGVVEKLAFTADAYYNNVRDKIVALPTMYIWRMMNFGKADIYGVDVSASADILLSKNMNFRIDAGYSWQRALDVTDSGAKNYRHQMPYTPVHSGNFSLTFRNRIAEVSYLLTAVGQRYMLPQNIAQNRMHGYFEHSLIVGKDVVAGDFMCRVRGEFLNIGNERYEIIRYYPMPGFSWRLSISVYY